MTSSGSRPRSLTGDPSALPGGSGGAPSWPDSTTSAPLIGAPGAGADASAWPAAPRLPIADWASVQPAPGSPSGSLGSGFMGRGLGTGRGRRAASPTSNGRRAGLGSRRCGRQLARFGGLDVPARRHTNQQEDPRPSPNYPPRRLPVPSWPAGAPSGAFLPAPGRDCSEPPGTASSMIINSRYVVRAHLGFGHLRLRNEPARAGRGLMRTRHEGDRQPRGSGCTASAPSRADTDSGADHQDLGSTVAPPEVAARIFAAGPHWPEGPALGSAAPCFTWPVSDLSFVYGTALAGDQRHGHLIRLPIAQFNRFCRTVQIRHSRWGIMP